MNKNIKKILVKCNAAYAEGDIYSLTPEEQKIIFEFASINIIEMTDANYDKIYYLAKETWPDDSFFTELQTADTGFGKKITHDEPMGSMEELKTGDWDKWKVNHTTFIASDKLDGCSIILTYEKGKLTTVATRGKGVCGKDIMRHISCISTIPQTIPYTDKLVVRGELLCPKADIPTMLAAAEKALNKPMKNGRNTVSGLLNRKETISSALQYTHFVAYWNSVYHENSFASLMQFGFEVPFHTIISVTATEEDLVKLVETRLSTSTYELDGVILTQKDKPEEGFITGTINPKCSRKFKIGIYDNIKETTVIGITWQLTKLGKFCPVINVEPIELCGSTISNVTGHNYQNVIDSHCGIGAKIKIKRAGLVIPYLEEVLVPSDDFNLPQVKTVVNGVDLYLAEEDISEENIEVEIQKLVYFGKKLGIEQLGYGNCKKLYQDAMAGGLMISPWTMLGLPEGYIIDVIGKNGIKIEESLKKLKSNLSEPKFAAACGLFGGGIGERILQVVFDKYSTLDVNEEQLRSLEGFETKRITQYLHWLPNWLDVKQMLSKTVVFSTGINNESDIFTNYVVCFTGVRDKELEKTIVSNGGKLKDNVTTDVNILVAKDINSNSSKILKAKQLGCKIITLADAQQLFTKKKED